MVQPKSSALEFYGFSKAAGIMREIIHDSANDPALIAFTIRLLQDQGVRGGEYFDEAKAIFQFVRDEIRYTGDVFGEDIYRNPLLTLQLKAGDCNNKVALGCSMAKAVGFPCRMVFVFGSKVTGASDEFPFHVYFQLDLDKGENPDRARWVNCETIPVPAGSAHIGPERLLDFGMAMTSGYPEFIEVN